MDETEVLTLELKNVVDRAVVMQTALNSLILAREREKQCTKDLQRKTQILESTRTSLEAKCYKLRNESRDAGGYKEEQVGKFVEELDKLIPQGSPFNVESFSGKPGSLPIDHKQKILEEIEEYQNILNDLKA